MLPRAIPLLVFGAGSRLMTAGAPSIAVAAIRVDGAGC
jgi:hypothetical protein